jgi:ABC-type transporter Mla subunit MlaD
MALFRNPPKTPAQPAAKADPPPPPPPPPAGLSKDEVKALLETTLSGLGDRLGSVVQQLNERIEALAARQPQVVVQPPAPPASVADITDEEIDRAVLSGQGAAQRIRALVDRAVNAATERIIKERVQPLEEFGVRALGDVTQRVVATSMKYYNRFKKEIDEQLNTLAPAARSNPLVIETIYNAVVGRHAEELANEAAEAAVRQAQEQTKAPAPGTGAGGQATERTDEVPTLQDFLGPAANEAKEALQHKVQGADADAFARSLGYKDWASYMKMYQELLSAETEGSA